MTTSSPISQSQKIVQNPVTVTSTTENPVKKVAHKAMGDLAKTSSNEKKVKASLWSRIKKCFQKIFPCCRDNSGKKRDSPSKKSERQNSSTSSSLTLSSNLSSKTKTEIPKVDVFEALDWILSKPKPAPQPAPKPAFIKKDWKNDYPDYVARDLKGLGLAIEEIRECPQRLQIKAADEPISKSDKEYQEKNTIFFKNFKDFDIAIMHQDLLECDAEVIVNAANTALCGGGGIDGAIHAAGGSVYKREHWNLKRHYHAKFTSGYAVVIKDVQLKSNKLDKEGKKTTKDVIVVAGPSSKISEKANNALYSCYFNSLVLAHLQGKKSIAFPAISTGIFGFPKGPAAEISLRAIEDFITAYPNTQLKTIGIHCFNPASPNKKEDRKALMFYQDVVNCYPTSMSMEREDNNDSS